MVVEEVGSPSLGPGAAKWLGYGLAAAGIVIALMARVARAGPIADVLTVIAVLIPIAVLGCLFRAPEAFEINYARLNSRMVNAFLILPVLALYGSGRGVALIDFTPCWLLAGAGALMALLVGVWAPMRSALKSPLVLLVFLMFYGAFWGWAGPLFIDAQLDHAAGQVFATKVTFAGVSYRRYGQAYYLVLEPWGPMPVRSQAWVPVETYRAFRNGGTACVTLHPGALAIPWYSAAPC